MIVCSAASVPASAIAASTTTSPRRWRSIRRLKQQELERDGLSAGDARAAARREMGNITRAREDSRSVWIASWLESVWQDIVYALRSLRRQPSFTLAALAALILGIGINSSAFTFFNAIGLRPWPVHDPSRVVRIYDRGPGPAAAFTASAVSASRNTATCANTRGR